MVRRISRLYTAEMARTPSLAREVASSFRVSLTRAGEGADAAWLADVAGHPGVSARAATPEEAVRRALAQVDISGRTEHEVPASESRAAGEARHSGRLLVRMPATLHDELARVAEKEGVSLNQLITGALAAAVEWRRGEQPDSARAAAARTAPPQSKKLAPPIVSARRLGVALVANFVAVAVAAVLAIALLVVAWLQA